jgi:hypothetical protein
MIDDRPYGYFVEEGELQVQLDNAKKEVIPKFEFNKYFYWHEIKTDDEDVISKWKCVSTLKNSITTYDNEEFVIEVIKSTLMKGSVVYNTIE